MKPISAAELNSLEKQVNERLIDRKVLLNFIKNGASPVIAKKYTLTELRDQIFRGDTRFGQYETSFYIPNEVITPPKFDWNLYALNANKTDFQQPIQYSYMPTFNLKTFTDQESSAPLPQLYTRLRKFFFQDQIQTRGGDIWRNLAGVLHACDLHSGTEDYPLRILIRALLHDFDSFPFYRSGEQFKFDNEDTLSIFPLIIYMKSSCLGDVCIGNASHIESIITISTYLSFCSDHYWTLNLKIKRNFYHHFNTTFYVLVRLSAPYSAINGLFTGVRLRSSNEPQWIIDLLEPNIYKDTPCPTTVAFIDFARTRSKTIEDLLYLQSLCRQFGNTRLYLVSIPELSRVKGSQPRIEQLQVQPPIQSQKTSDNQPYKFEVPITSTLAPTSKYLSLFESTISNDLRDLHFNSEPIFHYTTRSGGRKVGSDIAIPSSNPLFRQASNKRIVLAALEADYFKDWGKFVESLTYPTMLGGRNQIRRRQRQIFIIGNEMFLLHFPLYRIEKSFTRMSPHASVGKQTGSYLDVLQSLVSTGNGWLSSAMDVSGMDASIQESLRLMTSSFCLNVSKNIDCDEYGPFIHKETDIIDMDTRFTSGTNKAVINAITQCIALSISNPYKSLYLKSDIFGEMFGQNQVYGSGLPSTSDHHVVALVGALKGSELDERNKRNTLSTRADISIMGDDLLLTYVGESRYTERVCKDDAEVLKRHGFEVDESASVNVSEFLQQQAVCGRYAGYGDRIALFTSETPNYKSTPNERCSEDFAVFADMLSRCYNTEGLTNLLWIKSMYTNRRITVHMTGKQINSIMKAKLSGWSKMSIQILNDNPTVKNEFGNRMTPLPPSDATNHFIVQIYLPLIWLFLAKGGELPWPSLIGKNGVIVPAKSMYGPRGQICNRLLFQLSDDLSIPYSAIPDDMKLCRQTLSDYRADVAYNMCQYNLTKLRENVREERISPHDVHSQALRLRMYLNQSSVSRSEVAYNSLLAMGIRMDTSIVYAFNIETRIKNALMSAEVDRYEYVMSNDAFETMVKNANKGIAVDYSTRSGMRLNAYRITFDTSVPRLDNLFKDLYDVSISASLEPGTEGWQLLQILGFMNYHSLANSAAISKLTGKFAYFKEEDKTFEFAKYVKRNHPLLMEDFYDAVNMPQQTRNEYERLLLDLQDDQRIYYPYTLTNRQLFFISSDVMRGIGFYSSGEQWTKISQHYGVGYSAAIVYLYVLSHCFDWLGEKLAVEW
ncbi:RdRP [Choristoneura occidentalis cypovirus 16]|uniref:RdRP n=1 Tax=Choristoneura fumiferana cypovirus TaxID=59730 RepID=B1PR23_CPVCS|nr:RdRP [Choristoneura occidentalis cypovirus 16]ACA53380.1 RdRP [Choristoneura occidentalis cypovirus 16]